MHHSPSGDCKGLMAGTKFEDAEARSSEWDSEDTYHRFCLEGSEHSITLFRKRQAMSHLNRPPPSQACKIPS